MRQDHASEGAFVDVEFLAHIEAFRFVVIQAAYLLIEQGEVHFLEVEIRRNDFETFEENAITCEAVRGKLGIHFFGDEASEEPGGEVAGFYWTLELDAAQLGNLLFDIVNDAQGGGIVNGTRLGFGGLNRDTSRNQDE